MRVCVCAHACTVCGSWVRVLVCEGPRASGPGLLVAAVRGPAFRGRYDRERIRLVGVAPPRGENPHPCSQPISLSVKIVLEVGRA